MKISTKGVWLVCTLIILVITNLATRFLSVNNTQALETVEGAESMDLAEQFRLEPKSVGDTNRVYGIAYYSIEGKAGNSNSSIDILRNHPVVVIDRDSEILLKDISYFDNYKGKVYAADMDDHGILADFIGDTVWIRQLFILENDSRSSDRVIPVNFQGVYVRGDLAYYRNIILSNIYDPR